MLFTVFQYIPILEEETQTHSTELAKKGNESDGTDGDNAEQDTDVDDAVNAFFDFNFSVTDSGTQFRSSKKEDYNSFFQKINIPPPKA